MLFSSLSRRVPLLRGGIAPLAALAALFADAATKIAATALPTTGVSLVPGLLALRPLHNEHLAFSTPVPSAVALALPVVALVVLAWVFRAEVRPLAQLGLGLLLGGGLANIIDRATNGAVRDMIALEGLFVCNVADVAITVGVLLVAWSQLRKPARP